MTVLYPTFLIDNFDSADAQIPVAHCVPVIFGKGVKLLSIAL